MHNIDMNLYFSLFQDCVPVKGAKRSIICDFRREEFKLIPNLLFDIIIMAKKLNIDSIINHYECLGYENSKDNILEYLNYLEKNELGFYLEDSDRSFYPEIDFSFEQPGMISNAIIDLNKSSNYDVERVLYQLHKLGCAFIQIRIFDQFETEFFERLLKYTLLKDFKSVELIMPYNENFDFIWLTDLYFDFPISKIFIFNTPFNRIKKDRLIIKKTKANIYYFEDNISDNTHCGIVSPQYFVPNIDFFSESTHFNSCLNKKIAIDVDGNIKNCPSMKLSYGNVSSDKLQSIITKDKFRMYWDITKDQVNVCRDCEFRHVCVDCRAFTENSGILSKPLKCNYDPYTATWKE